MARPVGRSPIPVVLACALSCAGCVDELTREQPDGLRAPIVDGTREPGEPWVVMMIHEYGGGCSASVVGPRVVITARHCVRQNEGAGAVLPASGFRVYVGASMYSFVDEYRVTEVRSTSGTSIDNNDFAILILDRDFRHGTHRWEFAPWPNFMAGARITAIGYGQTRFADPDSAGTKYRRDGLVIGVGPLPRYGVGDREFVSEGENTCQGDSGGPLLYDDVVVGVVSRGEEGCTGVGWMTRVSGFADMIRQALQDTGACVPTGHEVCDGLDNDCWGGPDDGLEGTCPCAGGTGASPEVCDGTDNDCNGIIDDLEACGCRGGAPPTAEVCDGIDNDCNGQIDEVCQHLGEGCSEDRQCSSGLCLDGLCTAHCTPGGAPCPENGFCDGPACGSGLCRPGAGGRQVGASCGSNGECQSGFCAPTRGGGSVCARSCRPDALDCFATEVCATLGEGCGACLLPGEWDPPRWFGEPCGGDGDCMSGMCLTDGPAEGCGRGCAYRHCTGPCGAEACPPGGHCRDGLCVRGPESGPGDTCVSEADCPGGRCVALFGVSRCVHPCPGDGVCPASFSCREGVCWPDLLHPGDPCNPGEEGYCAGGLCDFVGEERLCLEPCGAARECPSGLVCLPYPSRLAGVCVPLRLGGGGVSVGGDEIAGTCRCSAAGARGGEPLGLLACLLALAVFRRRAR